MTCAEDLLLPHFEISAPYPALQTTIILKRPSFSDGEGLTDSVAMKRSTNGTVYTYVKTKNNRRKITWKIDLTRPKSIELMNFMAAYFSSKVQVIDHRGRTWIGNFTNNPFETTSVGRAGPACYGWLVGEDYTTTLEFEGTEVL